jgi:CheY-like chemotaxis protein
VFVVEKTVLDVGQCGVDGPRLEKFLSRGLHCRVDNADTIDDAIEKLTSQHYDLCLVNRKLAFEGSSGVDLIAAAKDAGVDTPIMLVSDREDAQEEATELDALPGFGKSQLDDPATVKLLREALEH